MRLAHHYEETMLLVVRRAFTIVELMIVLLILSILATIIIPRFSSATDLASANSLREDLRYIRTQILVYQAQHLDVPPGYPNGNRELTPTETAFVNQMTEPTSKGGEVGESHSLDYPFGPYLMEIPANPINGRAEVLMIGAGSSMPEPPGEGTEFGWVYQPSTLELRGYVPGTDEDGVPYYDY